MQELKKKRKLILSFKTMLRYLKEGKLDRSDLDSALFYLDRPQNYVMDRNNADLLLVCGNDHHKAEDLHTIAVFSYSRARMDDRLLGSKHCNRCLSRLNALLKKFSIDSIQHGLGFMRYEKDFVPTMIAEQVRERNLPVEVIH